jgi:hypothetical protein
MTYMVAHTPRYLALLRHVLGDIALDAFLHDVVLTDGAIVHVDVPT